MVLPTVLILLLSWAAGLGGETRPRAAAERRPGRAQRRGAGPRARVRSPRLLSALSARLSRPRAALPARYCPPRVPTALPPAAARAGCGAPGQAFPAPTAGRPYQPSFSLRFPGSRGAQASRPRTLPQPPQPCPGPSPGVRADSQQLARLAARRVHCSGSGREGGSERARRSGAGLGVGRRCACPTRAPSLPIALGSECLQPARRSVCVCVCHLYRSVCVSSVALGQGFS